MGGGGVFLPLYAKWQFLAMDPVAMGSLKMLTYGGGEIEENVGQQCSSLEKLWGGARGKPR